MDNLLLSISYLFHLLATVLWIGGLGIFMLLLWPLSRQHLDNDAWQGFWQAILVRFRPLANFSLVVLLATGMVQMSADPNYEGFLTFSNTWSQAMLLKHIAFGGMAIIAAIIQFGLVPATERATILASRGDSAQLALLLQKERRLLQWMLGLGLIVLLFTAIATAV